MYHEAVFRFKNVLFLNFVGFLFTVSLLLLEESLHTVNTVPDDEPSDCDTQMNVIKQ